MFRFILLNCLLIISHFTYAKNTIVKTHEELKAANKAALPGDIIILENGEWKNLIIELNCIGTRDSPITFKAETGGMVTITGNSRLSIGGSYIIVDGLHFINGFAGNDAIIKFCIDKKQVANNCRVTNTLINDFNNPKRLNENYWVAFYGKNNRLDHCSFLNKKNIGVLLAVILEDERSRENFHSIDHNYFGVRPPLASNGGEIIRVGVSQHCEFNSNTLIADNYFDNCDGETEIVSIKSGSNIIRNNLFKECQGSVVLRHGDNNTVENNIFLGNNKVGTGGIRIINKDQWVVNNFFYQCKGEGFRSPLAIMNGVPNSPANRYVAVSNAVIANNSYVDCAPIGLCEGSDTERSVAPSKVLFLNNIFYSTLSNQLANVQDDINGVKFYGNLASKSLTLNNLVGFNSINFSPRNQTFLPVPVGINPIDHKLTDSILNASLKRLTEPLSQQPGFSDTKRLDAIQENATKNCGATWFSAKKNQLNKQQIKTDCKDAAEIVALLAGNNHTHFIINLTGSRYVFNEPLDIMHNITFTSSKKSTFFLALEQTNTNCLFQLKAGNSLQFNNVKLDLSKVNAAAFISSDTTGSSNHSNFEIRNCHIINLNGSLFTGAKSSVSDSIVIANSEFTNTKGTLLNFTAETDKRGYYNVEKLIISGSTFSNHSGQLLSMLRGGNDESTMGPNLIFTKNTLNNFNSNSEEAIIHLYGTQFSHIENNKFNHCNKGKTLIMFEDAVRAKHQLFQNVFVESGEIITNKYVVEQQNVIR